MKLVALLRSPRFALSVIGFIAAYSAAGAWLPWSLPGGAPPPAWASSLGLDHPFATPLFLVAVALLFASVLACTWGKPSRILRLLRGELPPSAVRLPARPGADLGAFLRAHGFRKRGDRWLRQRAGLWGGWVLHLGLLALIAGVLVQQSLFDTGLFELTEGQTLNLDAPGALRWRHHGILARGGPPDLEATLYWFDPYARQEGYAPDRLSQIGLKRPGRDPVIAFLDRSAGVRVGAVEIFHAIPTGYAAVIDISGMGRRSVHLRQESAHVASVGVDDPAGQPARFVLTSERKLDDPLGTGAMALEIVQKGTHQALQRGAGFRFGDRDATLLSIARWGEYTYSLAPGMAAVFAGFGLVLAGCALLLLSAGVARPDADADAASVGVRVFLVRGAAALAAEWESQPVAATTRQARTERS